LSNNSGIKCKLWFHQVQIWSRAQKKLNLPPGWSDSVIEEKLSEIAADDIKLAKRTGKPRSSGLGLFNKLREADKENAEIALRLTKLNADSAIAPRQVRDENVISEIFDI